LWKKSHCNFAVKKQIHQNQTMKTQIDLKSALLGIGVGVFAMFAMGAETSSNEIGRYQVSAAQSFIAIVDTKTGQAWGFGPQNTSQYRNDGNFWNAK
jgi:hypothetical protein